MCSMIDVEKFIQFLDNINSIIDISLNNSLENNSENLETEILDYMKNNYTSIIVSRGPILQIINDGYKIGTERYKKQIEFKIADTKYTLTEENVDLDIALKESTDKLNKLFNTISLGSNTSYLDYIKNTLGSIMKYLMEKSNGHIMFAKKSMEIRNDIEKMVSNSFKNTMNEYGENLKNNMADTINKEKQNNLINVNVENH